MLSKRKKQTRLRGSHTMGKGFKKKARGSGHRGGVGMAGTGKRADQKKTLILNSHKGDYFGKDKAIRKKLRAKLKVLNLETIIEALPMMIASKQAREKEGVVHVHLKGHKVLSKGEVSQVLMITASAASKAAIDKVAAAGGEIILPKEE